MNQGTQTRTFTYNPIGLLTSVTNPESGTVSYAYDMAGNLVSKTDANQTITCFGYITQTTCTGSLYDPLNRPTLISYNDGTPWVTLTYDGVTNGIGQLTSVSNSNSTTSLTAFDNLGRLTASTQTTNGQPYPFSYTYNLAGALLTETYPSQRTITITPDSANRPNTLAGTLAGQTKNYITGTQYSPSSGISSLARGNGLTNSLAYNSRLQPTSIQEKRSSDNSVLFNLAPNWVNPSNQNNGTLWNLSTTANGLNYTQTFGYDALNRLTSASEGSAWSQSYNYDQYGNMWMPTTTNGLPTPAIGPVAPTANAYTAANGTVTNRNLNSTYDAAGNLTLFGSTAITYDANNLQTAAGSNTYAYDGLGQRVSRTIGSAPTTYYVYDAFGQLSAEYSAAPVTTPPCVTCYLTYDHLGSSRMVTNSNAQIVALHDYAPFGQEIPAGVDGRTSLWGASDNVNQKFTGQERDSEANLDFFQARYMSSGLGRFMSPDPYNAGADPTDPQSWNGYGYVSGNPLNAVDPSGMYLVAPQPTPDPGDGDGNGVVPIWGFGGVIVLHGPGSGGQTNAGGAGGGTATGFSGAVINLVTSTQPGKKPAVCPAGATAGGLTYTPEVRSHIEERHLALLNGTGGRPFPSFNQNGTRKPASQYYFDPPTGTNNQNWTIVTQINAKLFNIGLPSAYMSRGSVIFTGALPLQNAPAPFEPVRAWIGVEYGGFLNLGPFHFRSR